MAAFKNKDNGTWYVQFRYTDWKGERQQKLKRGFATKREALEWEREFLMEKQADVNMTFESFVALYEKDIKPKLKLNTWLTKDSIIKKKILPYFANRKLSEITAKDIIRWQNEIRELRDYHGKPLSKTYLKTVHNQRKIRPGTGCSIRRYDTMKAYFYCRVAHDDSFSLERQAEELRRYAEQAGYTIVGVAAEHGSGMTLDRPALQEVMEAVLAGKVDVVLISSLDRIGRDWGMTKQYIALLTEHKVKLLCLRERVSSDISGASPFST